MDIDENAPSWYLTQRQLCDFELLATGAFSPLEGFMSQEDYDSVVQSSHLASGSVFPIPITLDITADYVERLKLSDQLVLRDDEGTILGRLYNLHVWKPNKQTEAELVYGTTDSSHPGVYYLSHYVHEYYVSGQFEVIQLPMQENRVEYTHSCEEMKSFFAKNNWKKVVAFQTRNPLHAAHVALTQYAMEHVQANLLLHPVAHTVVKDDIALDVRMRCYEAILAEYPKRQVKLSLLPLSMRMAGPREALWHALVRKNYGCTHFIVGRDHASPSNAKVQFYSVNDAIKLCREYEAVLDIAIVPVEELVYVPKRKRYCFTSEVEKKEVRYKLSGTEVRRRLVQGDDLPDWYCSSPVIKELQNHYAHGRGMTIYFTGLSGSGKSTIAKALVKPLADLLCKRVTLLDGDRLRKELSGELGFSQPDREVHLKRIAFLAAEINKHGGVVLCAQIAPYDYLRRYTRQKIQPFGDYFEIYLSTSIDECKKRDVKGLYKKAEKGLIKNFTGINDPYEAPSLSDIVINTEQVSVQDAVFAILERIREKGVFSGVGRQSMAAKKIIKEE